MTKILLEKKLTTDFTFGFELEMNVWGKFDYYSGGYDKNAPIAQHLNKYMGDGGVFKYDGSIRVDDGCVKYAQYNSYEYDDEYMNYDEVVDQGLEENIETPVEYNSPVMEFNPKNIQKTINMFVNGLDKLFSVNDSCGFHHHLSFPHIQPEDVAWIVCNLAIDDKARNLFKQFIESRDSGDITYDFVTGWSNDAYLDELKKNIEEINFEEIVALLNTDKYSLVNVHSNNTIEWRGPRGFLDSATRDTLIQFYSQLWNIVNWISRVLDKNEINGMSKENFLKGMIIGSDRQPIRNYPKFTIQGRYLDEDTLSMLIGKIDNNEFGVIYGLMSHPVHLDQLIQKLFNRSKLTNVIKRMTANGEELPQKFYDLCYKYVPAFVADKASIEALEKTSARTFRRLTLTKGGVTDDQLANAYSTIFQYISDKALSQAIDDEGNILIGRIMNKTGIKYIPRMIKVAPNDMKYPTFQNVMKYIFKNDISDEEKETVLTQSFETLPEENKQEVLKSMTKSISQIPFFIKYIDTIDNRDILSILGYSAYLGKSEQVKQALLNSGKVTPKLLNELESYFTKHYEHNWDVDDLELIP